LRRLYREDFPELLQIARPARFGGPLQRIDAELYLVSYQEDGGRTHASMTQPMLMQELQPLRSLARDVSRRGFVQGPTTEHLSQIVVRDLSSRVFHASQIEIGIAAVINAQHMRMVKRLGESPTFSLSFHQVDESGSARLLFLPDVVCGFVPFA